MAKAATYEPMTLAHMQANGVTRLERRHVARCRAQGIHYSSLTMIASNGTWDVTVLV
jgi:hypothetical protein